MVKCEVSKSGCVRPPNNAPVDVLIRINIDGTEECFLNPGVTWFFPCHYRENTRTSCEQFRDVIEKFMQEFKKMLEGGAILYAPFFFRPDEGGSRAWKARRPSRPGLRPVGASGPLLCAP